MLAGHYLVISVRDTGMGMSADVQRHAFEPFFTTKSAESGTGLGLSQVYGFVSQSAGQIRLLSEVGEGTTVKIYLPVAEAERPELHGSEALSEALSKTVEGNFDGTCHAYT